MKEKEIIRILPYSAFVGQDAAKLALEIGYVEPRIGGILLSGERGTGKSTLVRAFSRMVDGKLPVTIPINATEDRVVGGYRVDALMKSKAVKHPGLLEQANKSILYIDEVNLLDDHIVNIILDVTSTGILEVQHLGMEERLDLDFTLVGTMNPEEGSLRPQLIDRFALTVQVKTEPEYRVQALNNALDFDAAVVDLERGEKSDFLQDMEKQDKECFEKLEKARNHKPKFDDGVLSKAIKLVDVFKTHGNRGEQILVRAARAAAAIEEAEKVTVKHLREVAPLALQHRQRAFTDMKWDAVHKEKLEEVL